MKLIKNILQKIIKEDNIKDNIKNNIKDTIQDKKILGRWYIDYCDIKLNHKIDLSNEDHCGPCGQYILDKKNYNDVKIYSKKN